MCLFIYSIFYSCIKSIDLFIYKYFLIYYTIKTIFCIFFIQGAISYRMILKEERCYWEEIPLNTVVLLKYATDQHFVVHGPKNVIETRLLAASRPETTENIYIRVFYANKTLFMERKNQVKGFISFTAPIAGEYVFCFRPNNSEFKFGKWNQRKPFFEFYFQVLLGDTAEDFAVTINEQDVHTVERGMERLVDKIRSITTEQIYQKEQEISFHESIERINSNLSWCTTAKAIAVILAGIWQINYLKQFFIRRKIY